MKLILKLLIAFSIGSSPLMLSGQWVASSCEAPDSIVAKYEFDAAKLALRRTYEVQIGDTAAIEIVQDIQDSVMRALLAVYNAVELDAREDVVEIYDIHAFADPNVNSVLLMVDTSYDWVSSLLDIGLSGNTFIDSLLFLYELEVSSFTHISGNEVLLRLKTEQAINSRALGLEMAGEEGIINWVEDLVAGESPRDITYSVHDEYIELVYRYSWGDCTAGCIYDHFWRFRVDENCMVSFEEDFGTPLSTQNVEDLVGISVFPNPTTDEVQINLLGPGRKDLKMQLYNATGQLIRSFELNSRTGLLSTSLSLYGLPMGIYFIAFQSEDSVLTEKIWKQ
ncbi:MAG: T9SS type A sorting domain-containing protein [Bacteroidota bacterium]